MRIYVCLTDPEEVHKARGEQPHGLGALTPEEAHKKCFLADAKHYRRCYIDMVTLVPELRGKIYAQADYAELLLGSLQEACSWIDGLERVSPFPDVSANEHVNRKYGCTTDDELNAFLTSVYVEH